MYNKDCILKIYLASQKSDLQECNMLILQHENYDQELSKGWGEKKEEKSVSKSTTISLG